LTLKSKKGEASMREASTLRRTLLAGVLSLVVAIGIGRFAYTPTLPVMQEAFGLSTAAASALASSNYFGYLVGAILAALVPPGRARGRLLRASLALVAATTAAVALTTAFPAWLTLRFLSGLAGAGIFVFASSAVLEQLSRRGKRELAGRFYSGVGIGIALSGLVVMPANAFLAETTAWRADWLLLGALAAAFVIPCWAWLPESGTAGDPDRRPGSGSEKVASAANKPVTVGVPFVMGLLCIAYFLEGGGYIVTGTFLPVIVEGLPGLEGAGAGLWVLVGLAAAPSTLLWTRVASRIGRPPALVLVYTAQAVGVALPVVSSSHWAAAGYAVLFGGTVMGVVTLTLTYANEVAGTRRAGFAIGSLTAVYGVGQVLGPLVAAALAGGANGFGPALVAASTVVAFGGVLMFVVWVYEARTRASARRSEAAE
jgi:predicted MFS family arabinose efflux permease